MIMTFIVYRSVCLSAENIENYSTEIDVTL